MAFKSVNFGQLWSTLPTHISRLPSEFLRFEASAQDIESLPLTSIPSIELHPSSVPFRFHQPILRDMGK